LTDLRFWFLTTDVLALIIEAHRRGRVRPAFCFSEQGGGYDEIHRRARLVQTQFVRGRDQAGITDHAARTIIGDEARRRKAKTARLRRARLENEAKLAAMAAPAGSRRKGGLDTSRKVSMRELTSATVNILAPDLLS
jgi:hypothetical protein